MSGLRAIKKVGTRQREWLIVNDAGGLVAEFTGTQTMAEREAKRTEQFGRKVVGAYISASAYPRSHKWGEDKCRGHAVTLDETGEPTSVLCGQVKLDNILPDRATYNMFGIDCERCVAFMKRRGLTIYNWSTADWHNS